MKRKILQSLLMIFLVTTGFTQQSAPVKELTLDDCLKLGIANNFDLKKQGFEAEKAGIRLQQAQKERDPSVSADFSQGFNLGRNIDPFSNQFVTTPINSANLGLNANYTLYDGGVMKNSLMLQKTERSIAETEKQRLELELKRQITLSFLEVVLKQDLLKLREQEETITETQINRVKELVQFGNSASSLLTDLQAQLENDRYAITSARAELLLAKRQLLSQMNETKMTDFTAKEPVISSRDMAMSLSALRLKNLPDLQLGQYEINRSSINLSLAQASRMPRVFLSGGLFTRYSSQASPRINFPDKPPLQRVEASPNEFVLIGGNAVPLNRVITTPVTEEMRFGYFNQLVSNSGLAFSLNVQYPILDKGLRNSQLQTARVDQLAAKNNYYQIQTRLTNQLAEIVTYLGNSSDLYQQAVKSEAAQKKAFDTAQLRFEEGLITFTEFDRSKMNLQTARSNVLRNKLTHYFYNLLYGYYAN